VKERISEEVTDKFGRKTCYDYDSVTAEANKLAVQGEREKEYGHPHPWAVVVAKLWKTAFGWDVKPWQVSIAMILFKVARECFCHGRDNLVDIAGYAEVANRVIEAEATVKMAEALIDAEQIALQKGKS
jgi:hypothetical protein